MIAADEKILNVNCMLSYILSAEQYSSIADHYENCTVCTDLSLREKIMSERVVHGWFVHLKVAKQTNNGDKY